MNNQFGWQEDGKFLWFGKETDHKSIENKNLRYANLSYADLSYANLSCTNLRNADLSNTDLSYANLSYADLSYADLFRADLSGVNLDFSIINLSCKDLCHHLDDRLAIQRLYHLLLNVEYSKNVTEEVKATLLTEPLISLANKFHRVGECSKIRDRKENK
jgi:hypothetical protein